VYISFVRDNTAQFNAEFFLERCFREKSCENLCKKCRISFQCFSDFEVIRFRDLEVISKSYSDKQSVIKCVYICIICGHVRP
jgi:hypothetical protein